MRINIQPIEKQVLNTDGSLSIHSIFYTIQGEGPFSGHPAIFIRLAGCNLQCPSCFVSNTEIRMGNGTKKRISDIKEGDFVLSYNEKTYQFEPKRVLKTMQRETFDIYRVYSGEDKGRCNPTDKIFATGEHPFLIKNKGWIEVKDLQPGDVMLHLSTAEHKRLFNPMKDKSVAKQVSATLKQGYKTGRIEKYHPTDEQKQAQSDRMIANNPMKDPKIALKQFLNRKDIGHKTNVEHLFEVLCKDMPVEFVGDGSLVIGDKVPDFKVIGQNKVIEVWDESSPFGKIRNESNYVEERTAHFEACGYKVLCLPMRYPKSINQVREFESVKKQVSEFINNGEIVKSVEKLEVGSKAWVALAGSAKASVKVFNLEVEDNHTYIANGKIVHNCDTNYTSSRESMTLSEIKIAVAEHYSSTDAFKPLIVITGGEPFRQNIAPLVRTLVSKGFRVQIETNGTLWVEDMPWDSITIVCSPKTGKINPKLLPHIDAFKYVMKSGELASDGLPVRALDHTCAPILARPPADNKKPIYLQPMDEQNEEKNSRNAQLCAASCMRHGYIFQLQTHKIIGLE